jgi:hypothetical protein
MNKLSLLSSVKLPEFLQAEYPALVTFVEAYYRFLETLETIDTASNFETVTDKYLNLYKETVAKGFSDPKNLSVRDFIFANKDFFSRKGTESAFTYFFKAYFGDTVEIIKPDYLVASGAEAAGDFFFYVTIKSGVIDEYDPIIVTTQIKTPGIGSISASTSSKTVVASRPAFDEFSVGNFLFVDTAIVGVIDAVVDSKTVTLTKNSFLDLEYRNYHTSSGNTRTSLDVVAVKQLDSATYEVRFVPYVGYKSEIGDAVTVEKNGIVTFSGVIKPTPVNVVPYTQGNGWQVGQVIQLPSTTTGTPTILRVTKTDINTGLVALEILQHGYPLSSEQFTISSFQSVADNSNDSSGFSQEQQDDGHYEQAMLIYDNINSVNDSIVVSLTDTGSTSYFSEEYQLEDFTGNLVGYEPMINPVESVQQTENPELWAASFANLRIVYGAYAKEKTKYSSENSLISNQNTRIHDSLFYQAFAYSLKTERDINEYRGSLDLIHPAGTKFSATHVKKSELINTSVEMLNTHGFPNPDGVSSNSQTGNINIGMVFNISGTNALGGV